MTAFRGDNVNSFDTSNRTPDPDRLVQGYFHSAATLNYARAVLASGLADLNAASHWDLGFVQDPMHRGQYKEMVDRILSSLDFMRVCGVADEAALKTVGAGNAGAIESQNAASSVVAYPVVLLTPSSIP